jgi:energy-converting hydrogenase Eha subunit C
MKRFFAHQLGKECTFHSVVGSCFIGTAALVERYSPAPDIVWLGIVSAGVLCMMLAGCAFALYMKGDEHDS